MSEKFFFRAAISVNVGDIDAHNRTLHFNMNEGNAFTECIRTICLAIAALFWEATAVSISYGEGVKAASVTISIESYDCVGEYEETYIKRYNDNDGFLKIAITN